MYSDLLKGFVPIPFPARRTWSEERACRRPTTEQVFRLFSLAENYSMKKLVVGRKVIAVAGLGALAVLAGLLTCWKDIAAHYYFFRLRAHHRSILSLVEEPEGTPQAMAVGWAIKNAGMRDWTLRILVRSMLKEMDKGEDRLLSCLREPLGSNSWFIFWLGETGDICFWEISSDESGRRGAGWLSGLWDRSKRLENCLEWLERAPPQGVRLPELPEAEFWYVPPTAKVRIPCLDTFFFAEGFASQEGDDSASVFVQGSDALHRPPRRVWFVKQSGNKYPELLAPSGVAPPIHARINAVLPQEKVVLLSVGREQGIVRGIEFAVFHGDDLVGKVEVITVNPDTSRAKILFTKDGVKIEKGDPARTVLSD